MLTDSLNPQVTSSLQDLMQAHIEGAQGYERIASGVSNDRLQSLFRERARQRRLYATELESLLIPRSDTASPQEASWLAAYRRTWIATKAILTTDKETSLLAEVERGEACLMHQYKELLKLPIGSTVGVLLDRQLTAMLHSLIEATRVAKEIGTPWS